MLGQYLKTGHDHCLPNIYLLTNCCHILFSFDAIKINSWVLSKAKFKL